MLQVGSPELRLFSVMIKHTAWPKIVFKSNEYPWEEVKKDRYILGIKSMGVGYLTETCSSSQTSAFLLLLEQNIFSLKENILMWAFLSAPPRHSLWSYTLITVIFITSCSGSGLGPVRVREAECAVIQLSLR